MNPDKLSFALFEGGNDPLGIKRETVTHSRGITAAPQHSQEKTGQQKRIDDRKKNIVKRPLHGFKVPNGESVVPGATFLSTGVPQATVAPSPTVIPGAVQLLVPIITSSPIVV